MNCAADLVGLVSIDALVLGLLIAVVFTAVLWWRLGLFDSAAPPVGGEPSAGAAAPALEHRPAGHAVPSEAALMAERLRHMAECTTAYCVECERLFPDDDESWDEHRLMREASDLLSRWGTITQSGISSSRQV